MSFTIGKTYTLVAGKDYSGASNTAVKLKGTVVAGSTAISFVAVDADPVTKLNQIKGTTGGVPVVSGPAYTGPVGLTSGTGSTLYTSGATAAMSGTYDFYVYDSAIPSSLDSPVLQIHVLASPGAVSFKTLTGQTVSLPANSLVAGGIYDYGISEVISIGTSGTLLGLAPAHKPFVI